MSELAAEVKKDLDLLTQIFRRLHLLKEQEIALYRVGKRMPPSAIKQMREMETTITTVMSRRRANINMRQRAHLENFKNKYFAQMRSWKNRMGFTDLRKKQRLKREERLRKESLKNQSAEESDPE